jgi:hypothetical protein
MSRIVFGVLAVALLGGAVPSQDKPHLPKGPQPRQVLATAGLAEGGVIVFKFSSVDCVVQLEETKVVVGGKEVTRRHMKMVPVTRQGEQRVKSADIQAATAGGKKVDAKELPKLLKKATAVLISADGKKVDPFYLKVLKEDTLVLVLPIPELKAGSGDRPSPPPPPPPPPPPVKK